MFYTQTLCHEPWEFLWNYIKTHPTNLSHLFSCSRTQRKILNKQKKTYQNKYPLYTRPKINGKKMLRPIYKLQSNLSKTATYGTQSNWPS